MDSGVTIRDPKTTWIAADAVIGADTEILPNTVIEGPVKIGKRCHVGPFARIRPGVALGDDVTVGNFVELVRSSVGSKTLIKHLTYLGDAEVGSGVNVGCGTITANFDGTLKHKTVIESGASTGSGTVFVAPVKMGKNSKTGAGAVVTRGSNIPAGATVAGVPAKVLKKGKSNGR
jgi:bifunctional UDP-N-acetylglucosamine pyrophosphorylase/glucosamine-1-phosphate N-acetyltransferase